MAELVNAQTNQIEEVPQDGVHQAITSGQYNLVKGQPFNVVDPDGKLISLPSEQVPEALSTAGYSIPTQAHITDFSNQQKYGEGIGNEVKAFGAGALRGATFGGSDVALPAAGIESREALRERTHRNPIASTTGEITGAAGSMMLAPELSPAGALAEGGAKIADVAAPLARSMANPETSPVVAKILASVSEPAAKTLGSAVEGAAYGLGNQVSETALGDQDLNAENILHNVGYGALFGGALGGTLGITGKAFSKEATQAALKDSIIESAALHPEHPMPVGAPQSLADIAQIVRDARDSGLSTDLPAKNALLEAEQQLAGDSQFPVHAVQLQSLESPYMRSFYKTFIEDGSEEGQALQQYEMLQKKEGVKLAEKFIQDIAPNEPLTEDVVKGGQRVVDAFTDTYKNEKEMLKPFFKKIDSVGAFTAEHPEELINTLNKSIPEAEQLIMRTPNGYEIVPYKASLPIAKDTWESMKDLVEALNEKDVTIGAIRNVRDSMRDRVNFLASPRSSSQISALRKGLMDYMQEQVQRALPEYEIVEGLNAKSAPGITPSVREVFKRYAINEENRSTMEKIFGGSISDKATFAKEIKPEDVLNRLFSNTISVKAAKDLLGPHFDEAAANYLKQQMSRVTDEAKNGFSSNKFATFLKSKAPELEEGFSSHPDQLNKLHAITDKMRILPDSISGNPSGTAKTSLMQKLQKLGGFLTPEGLMKVPGEALKAFSARMEGAQQRSMMDQILAGKQEIGSDIQVRQKEQQYGAFAKIERMAQQSLNTIKRDLAPMFTPSDKTTSAIKGILTQKLTPEDQQKKFEKISTAIKERVTNPTKFVDDLQDSTKDLHSFAPGISTALNTTSARATQFLATKLPAQEASSPLSKPYEPSTAELAKFNRYYSVVEKPLSILKQVQAGTLTSEGLEALQVVYPKLYAQMQSEALTHLGKVKDVAMVPYQKKLMLSMFLGQDLSNSLKPSNIASAQIINNTPQSGVPKSTQTGLGKLNKSEQIMTPFQKSSARVE